MFRCTEHKHLPAQAPTQPQLGNLIQPQPVQQSTAIDQFIQPNVVPAPNQSATANIPSAEERPIEEGVISETVEPEWLTPKIFKGSNLG